MEENYSNINQNGMNIPNEEMSVGEWLLTLFLLIIPVVNIVLLFVWAFGAERYKCRQNFAKAKLIWAAIIIAFYFIFIISFGGLIYNIISKTY